MNVKFVPCVILRNRPLPLYRGATRAVPGYVTFLFISNKKSISAWEKEIHVLLFYKKILFSLRLGMREKLSLL